MSLRSTPAILNAASAAGLIGESVNDGAYVIEEWFEYSPAPSSHAGGFFARLATSGDATITADPPLHGLTISYRWSGSTIMREFSTSSIVSGLSLKVASGFLSAFLR